MTLRHLRIFVEVATTGKMCDAAKNLFLSQPTVSQAIHDLEKHYGHLLFERLGRNLHITPFGQRLLLLAQDLLKDFDSLEKRMFEIGEKENLNIGATITVGKCILPYVIKDMEDHIPNLNTYSCISNTKLIEEKLLNSKLDIAIIEGSINNPNLITIPVIDDFLVLACNSKSNLANYNNLSLKQLEKEQFVLREKGSGTRKLFEEYIERNNLNINIVMESNCPGSIINSILINNYISVMSSRLFENEINNNKIKIFKLDNNFWNRNFKIVYHKDKFINNTIKTFISIIKNNKNYINPISTKSKILHD